MATDTLICAVIFAVGILIGYIIKWLLVSRTRTSGTIVVTHRAEKTLYSLELSEYPESIEFKKQVVFNVDVPEESSHRK